MSSDYLPFASQTGANVITQAQWASLIDRARGFQVGLAKSEEFNKVWRQASVMCAAIAEFIDARVPSNVVDDGNVTNLAVQFAQAIGVIVAASGLQDAPSNNRWYLRRNGGWQDSTNLGLDGGTW